MTTTPQKDPGDYGYQYWLDACDYWCQVRGQPEPPAPSWREVDGKMVMGRYVDPCGAVGLMQSTKDEWHHWYIRFLVSCAIPVAILGVDAGLIFIALPIWVIWYLAKRNHYRKLYDEYYAILQEINRTGGQRMDNGDVWPGDPVWVPYNKDRLKLIERRPSGVWP